MAGECLTAAWEAPCPLTSRIAAGFCFNSVMSTRRETLEALYAIFVLPLLCVWPILWALQRWRTWEVVAWLAAAAVGGYCYLRTRERERQRRGEAE